MDKNRSSSYAAALIFSASLFAAAFPAAGQSVLITIDQSNPTAVQFTATGNFSVNNSSVLNLLGVDLISYFTAAVPVVGGGAAISGTLTPGGTTVAYNRWISDNLGVVGTVDLNLYNNLNFQFQTFSTGSSAFIGTATVDLSALLADLPATGAQNNIYSGNVSVPGVVIGQWQVVPEPPAVAQLALGAMVFAGLTLIRRARHAAARR